jgi:PKD repeat protein
MSTGSVTVTEPVTNTPPNAGFTVSVTDLTASFTDTSGDSDGSITSWAWDFGDGTTSSAQSPSHSYAADGSYTVTLTVTDDDGATDTSTGSVTVTEPVTNTPPNAGFTVSVADLTASFTDTSVDSDGSITSHSWNFGDGNGSTAENPSHSYAEGGTYTVILTVTDDAGATDTASQSVTVSAPSSQPTLKVTSWKVRGDKFFGLEWTGLSGDTVTITRKRNKDQPVVSTTANDGAHTDQVGGGGTYVYQACDTYGVCTPSVTASL